MARRGPRRPNPIKIWRERRRFRKLSAAPKRPPGPRRPRPGLRARMSARRSIRKAAALPKGSRPNAFARRRARRAARTSQPSWATKPPKPKIPLGDRLSSALYRPKPLKVERPGIRERMSARAFIRHEGPKGPPRAPLFRGRMDKVLAAVVAGAACFVVLTWLVSKAPAPVSSAQSLHQQPQAPDEDIALGDYTIPPPPSPVTPAVEASSVDPTFAGAPTTSEPPLVTTPPTTNPPTVSPSPKPTTPSPSPTTPSPSPSESPRCFPDQEPRCPTTPAGT